MSARERHSKHLYRAALVLVGLLLAIIAARVLLTPPSFGQYGFYRGDNVAEQRALPVHHGWRGACDDCHTEQAKIHAGGAHKAVGCETCHAPLDAHAAAGKKVAAMPIDRSYKLCARCHRKLDARPASFPQVRIDEHLEAQGEALSPDVCLSCHQPHSPLEDL